MVIPVEIMVMLIVLLRLYANSPAAILLKKQRALKRFRQPNKKKVASLVPSAEIAEIKMQDLMLLQ